MEQNWFIPTLAHLGLSGRVEITLTLEKSGRIVSLIIKESARNEQLDLAAENAIKTSAPFPTLPEKIPGDIFDIYFVFHYNG